jgi:dTMP kinase
MILISSQLSSIIKNLRQSDENGVSKLYLVLGICGMTLEPGRLVVFEGVEGAGKSTQLQLLQTWLQEIHRIQDQETTLSSKVPPILVTREPGGTPLGQRIRQLLLDRQTDETTDVSRTTELLLYAADRAQHVETCLLPALERGTLVLCDRYTDSTMAYQCYGRGLDRSLIEQLNHIATGGLTSDLTLWLDVDPEVGLQRAQARQQPLDRMESAGLAFHQAVRQGFMELAEKYPDRIVRVDANQEEFKVTQHIQQIVQQYLQKWYPRLFPTSSDNLKQLNC